ncbi:MAG: nuclear transport factor 2 family protein [Gemmatirosa sp.]|nr:nuclear transport factor 2 family protein [Gemmatirosa sp.]
MPVPPIRCALAAAVAAIGFALGAAPLAAQAPDVSADSALLAALEVRVEDAVTRSDAAFLDGVYAPTFRFKHATGQLEDRAIRMAALRATPRPGTPRVVSRTVDSLEVEVHGDVALTTGRIHVRREGGDPADAARRSYTIRYARLYQRRDGRWLLVTHHSTAQTYDPP